MNSFGAGKENYDQTTYNAETKIRRDSYQNKKV